MLIEFLVVLAFVVFACMVWYLIKEALKEE